MLSPADRMLLHTELDRLIDIGIPYFGDIVLSFTIQTGKLYRIETNVSRSVLAEILRAQAGAK